MKRTLLDKVIGYISPSAEYNRILSANKIKRAYEAAQLFSSSDWSTANRSSANTETRGALPITRDRARDLTRNNAYANKALNVIVANTVGAGIVPKIKGRTKSQERAIKREWELWGEQGLCDKDGNFNFYGLQAAALRTIVESGEVIALKRVGSEATQLQMLEPDHIDGNSTTSNDCIQGIWVNDEGGIEAYQLYDQHPGEYKTVRLESRKVPANKVIHVKKIDRIGQLRGMPWAAPVANAIKDFGDYQNATLIRQKIAACYVAYITEDGNPSLTSEGLKQQRELDNSLEPGTTRYLTPGQDVKFANPPGVDQYDPFARQTLRSIACGFGISYESLTGDYSQVNFSSGRMGHLEMQRNIDMWRWQMLVPQFCKPAFEWFLVHCQLKGINVDGVTVQWTPPAREMINPIDEINSLKSEVRSGLKTLPEAIRERGFDPDLLLEETAEFNKKLDDLGLIFDSDPRRTTAQGMFQMQQQPAEIPDGEINSGDENETDAPELPSQS